VSRDEFKSVRNALIVMSGLAILAPAAMVGWSAHSAITSVEAKASAAIAQVQSSVNAVQIQVVGHVREDDQRVADLKGRVDQCCPVASAGATWDVIPPERRRRFPRESGDGG
jgi:hypothetical protein